MSERDFVPEQSDGTDLFTMRGLVAVVTGGSEGIGAAVAEELGRAGAKVVVASRREQAVRDRSEALAERGVDALGVAVDVRDDISVQEMVRATVDTYGGLDVLVNNAGGSFGDQFNRGPLLNLGPDDLLEAYRLNVVGAFLCARAAVPVMRTKGSGAIVNVASVAALQAEPGMAAYGSSKAALVQLTRYMAVEWAPHIRVNAVAPGHIDTPRVSARRSPERVERLLSEVALGRMGTGEDVAAAVRYLAAPSAAWMTGAVVQLDGGQKLG
jgi:NAD(P)-dependent dehydrogenase (short-subunit alcohol dehydrogenase family)